MLKKCHVILVIHNYHFQNCESMCVNESWAVLDLGDFLMSLLLSWNEESLLRPHNLLLIALRFIKVQQAKSFFFFLFNISFYVYTSSNIFFSSRKSIKKVLPLVVYEWKINIWLLGKWNGYLYNGPRNQLLSYIINRRDFCLVTHL